MSSLKNFIDEDIPNSINAYNLEKETEHQQFSSYFLGTNKYTDEPVRIKIYSKELIRRNASALAFINNEIFCMKLIYHKSFVQLYEFFETKKHIYLVTDIPKGKTLDSILKAKKTLPEAEAKKIYYKLVEAFIYLNSTFICHRNIHPSNIYYDESTGDIKIDHLFYAAFYNPQEKLINEDVGHPSYCCQEIYKRGFYNPERADVWSSGILLYFMLYGKFPYTFEEKDRAKERLLIVKFEPPNGMNSDLKELFEKVLEVSWSNRPDFKDIIKMNWLKSIYSPDKLMPGINTFERRYPIDDKVLKICGAYGFNTEVISQKLHGNQFNNGTAVYKLIVKKIENLKKTSKSDLTSKEFLDYAKDEKIKLTEDKVKSAVNFLYSDFDNNLKKARMSGREYEDKELKAMDAIDKIKEEYKKFLEDEENKDKKEEERKLKEKEEKERLEREAKEKAEKEAKEKEEAERLAKEKAEQEEKERLEKEAKEKEDALLAEKLKAEEEEKAKLLSEQLKAEEEKNKEEEPPKKEEPVRKRRRSSLNAGGKRKSIKPEEEKVKEPIKEPEPVKEPEPEPIKEPEPEPVIEQIKEP
ncbi:MAG: protein kinase, partial [archaeon]|nr:protein kinase [archaeon]